MRGDPLTEGVALESAMHRLERFVGEAEAARIAAECLYDCNPSTVQSPEQLLEIAERLIAHGAVATLVGRALRVQALRLGAQM